MASLGIPISIFFELLILLVFDCLILKVIASKNENFKSTLDVKMKRMYHKLVAPVRKSRNMITIIWILVTHQR